MKFLKKIHPMKRLKKLAKACFQGIEKNELATALTPNSKLICQENVIIQPYVCYEGLIYLGKNVFIGPYCFLRGPLYLDDDVKIGPYCEITRSIIGKKTTICHKNIIPDSVVEEEVWIAGGVIFCNTRLDTKKINFTWKKTKLKTKKFGAYVEKKCKIGVNVTAMPGTHISKSVFGPSTIKNKI
jgi:bifunctional UDP-N-acetylglucosamine pyrophosphorylase/glucosamine-1-phosphate N-acetyltransferase